MGCVAPIRNHRSNVFKVVRFHCVLGSGVQHNLVRQQATVDRHEVVTIKGSLHCGAHNYNTHVRMLRMRQKSLDNQTQEVRVDGPLMHFVQENVSVPGHEGRIIGQQLLQVSCRLIDDPGFRVREALITPNTVSHQPTHGSVLWSANERCYPLREPNSSDSTRLSDYDFHAFLLASLV